MTNRHTGGNWHIDTFSADVAISATGVWVKGIIVTAGATAAKIVFATTGDVPQLTLSALAGTSFVFSPRRPIEFTDSLKIDISASTHANATVMVFTGEA